MIKKCKVLTRNELNMVIMYDDIEVQMPTDGTYDKYIYVKKYNNTYALSSEDEYKKKQNKNKAKKSEVELARVEKTTDASDIL